MSFAPAEGNYPTNILEEKDWDIKSWPMLHPDGRFGIHHKRKTKLTDQQYLGERILHKDDRFLSFHCFFLGMKKVIPKLRRNFWKVYEEPKNAGLLQSKSAR